MSLLSRAIEHLDLGDDAENSILTLLDLTITECIPEFSEIHEAVTWLRSTTQKHWLRTSGTERWDQKDKHLHSERRAEFIDLFDKIGLRKPIYPPLDRYTNVLLLSSCEKDFIKRMKFFVELLSRNIQFESIYLVGGSRRLIPGLEPESVEKLGDEGTEIEMLIYLFNKIISQSDIQVKAIPTDTPLQFDNQGNHRRPNTEDTIKTWLDHKPKPGNSLVLSSQPYVSYQTAIVKSVVNDEYIIDSSGVGMSERERITVIFDSLARLIYVQCKIRGY